MASSFLPRAPLASSLAQRLAGVLAVLPAAQLSYRCARADMQAKLQALFLPTHILVPSCRRPNLRDRCLQKASRTRSGADGRDLCFLVVDAKGPPLAGSPYDRDLSYGTHGNALPRRTLRRPGPSRGSTTSPRSTRGGRALATSRRARREAHPLTRRTRTLPTSLRASPRARR